MYEDSVSTFIEARDQLLLSILDGLDVEDSIEEYVFAKANMEAEDFSHDITWRENICDSFVRKQYIPKEEYQQQISFDNDVQIRLKGIGGDFQLATSVHN